MISEGLVSREPTPTRSYTRVDIGDVGFIHKGQFHLLFSAGLPLGERQLGVDVPITFEQLDVGTLELGKPRPPGCLHTSTVQQSGDASFTGFSPMYVLSLRPPSTVFF